MKITADIDPGKILRARGMGTSHETTLWLAERFKMYCEPYVPRQNGILANTAVVVDSGSGVSVQYVQPYAHYQYVGRTMGPNVYMGPNIGWRSMAPKGGKYYTGGMLKHKVGGREWDKRMMADRKGDLVRSLAAYVGGKAK